uniref:Uncharacterized protein n=1 Tax=Chenopodium quinoa TaxID=63459 RepID=A0A803MJ91_CHEQI
MGVVEMNNQKKHSCIQGKQQDQQVMVQKKGKKRSFCTPGSMSAFLEFRKRQKENNEVLVESNHSLYNSTTALIQNDDDALNENNSNDVLNASDDDNGLNENANAVGTDFESDQELEDEVIAQFAWEETELASKTKKLRGPTMLPKVHARTREERPAIVLNKFGQPVGPTKEIVTEFKFFLGTVATCTS